MADISKITLPNGITYDIKDAVARAGVEAGVQLTVVTSLPDAAAATQGKIYLILSTKGQDTNVYDEYITVQNDTTGEYYWEKIGTTDVDLTDYSTKDHSHTVTTNVTVAPHEYKPAGTVSTPTITVAVTDADDQAAALYSMSSTGAYTPSQYTEGSYTPSAYVQETYEVSNEILTITASSYTPESVTMPVYTKESVTLPSRQEIKVTGSSTQPTFDGTQVNLTHNVTNNTVTSSTDTTYIAP